MRAVRQPTRSDLDAAREIVRKQLTPTPLIPSPALRDQCWLKLETFQPIGAFKIRGALAACSALPPGSRIVTASAGSHAFGIAWAAARLDVPAMVVVAETASPAKTEALQRLPVELVLHGKSYDDAEAHALALASDPARRATFVSPYNDPHVIAGQATLLNEVIDQLHSDRSLTVVAGVDGGGLVSGIALRATELGTTGRSIQVVGVESEQSLGVSASVRAGRTVEVEVGETIADGLSGNIEPGSVTVDIIRSHDVRLGTVTDAEIENAIRWLAREHGLIAEGARCGATRVCPLRAPDGV